jgi:hypothetical protein
MQKRDRFAYPTLIFIFLSCFFFLAVGVERFQTLTLMLTFFAMFFSYFWLTAVEKLRDHIALIVGIAARLVLFVNLPVLSDDFYRFIWDGRLLHEGIDPFSMLPSDVVRRNIPGLDQHLFSLLNSPEYFSIYPPLNQLLFYLAATAKSLLTSVNVLRSILLLCEIATFFLLKRIVGDPRSKALAMYFLNPLLILEGIGNLHFEVLVVFFLALAFYFLKRSKLAMAGMGMGLATATKLLPIIYLPYLFLRFAWKRGILITTIAMLTALASFAPFLLNWDTDGLVNSVGLYFNKFEFNASIYFLAREIGYWKTGYNQIAQIGPFLSVVSLLSIITVSIWAGYRKLSISEGFLWILTIYLLFATTVHPWYILPLTLFGVLSGYYFPIVWSGAILITYAGYTTSGYQLSIIWVLIEYFLVIGTMILEIWRKHAANNSHHYTDYDHAV